VDIKSKSERSKNMSAIRSKNTKPEQKIRKALFAKGFRYRLNVSSIPGTPDIVLPKYKTVIFVHGCFWHGHKNCYLFKIPSTNRDFWKNKIEANYKRDREIMRKLSGSKWRILIIWECSLKGKYKLNFDELMEKVILFLHSNDIMYEIRGRE